MAEEAKSGDKHSKGKRKRRLKHAEEISSTPTKSHRIDFADEVEVEEANPMAQKDSSWKNLLLILSLQNNDVGRLVSLYLSPSL